MSTTYGRTEIVLLDGSRELTRDFVGGKAYGVNYMRKLGMPVPPAFTLPTAICRQFRELGDNLPEDIDEVLAEGIAWLERETGRTFGGDRRPLLVSVRSGAAQSMPGMMDTVLNLGTSPRSEAALAAESGDADYAADTTRRFLDQYERVVGTAPTEDPWAQLRGAAHAVFQSWSSPRAQAYRRHHDLPDEAGTAVTIQAMVFGNLTSGSGTGVLFTRDPLRGGEQPYGEWLPGGQGEDVVSGRFDPFPLEDLAAAMPDVHRQLMECATRLEIEGRDVQDIEFTVEDGRLWMLQTRSAKRSPDAAVRLAVALEKHGIITVEEALARLNPDDVAGLLRPHLDPAAVAKATVLASGEPACPGLASGEVVTDAEAAEDRADAGVDTILARPTTDPDDVHGMIASLATITEMGGATSHAAVVSRELGRPCVVGCGQGKLDGLAGQIVTVDGNAGVIYAGILPMVDGANDDPAVATIAQWLGAESPNDVAAQLRKHQSAAG